MGGKDKNSIPCHPLFISALAIFYEENILFIWLFKKYHLTLLSKLKLSTVMAKKNQLTTADHLKYPEFERLVEALHKDKYYLWELYARLSFCTACRASDVLKFRWLDVLDLSETTVKEKKTQKARRISFNPSVKKKIHELWELLGSPSTGDYIFKSRNTGEPITIQYVNAKLKGFKDKYELDINHFSTHTFRKTFGRFVYDKMGHSAESLLLLNKILNHSNIQVTKTYIGITQDEISDIFNAIEC